MSEAGSASSSVASRSRSKKKSRKRKHSSTSASTTFSRGPYNVADSALPKRSPWYAAAEFSRFWQHYSDLMYSAHVSVLRHAATADLCSCELPSARKSQKRHKGHDRTWAPPADKWRPLSPPPSLAFPRLCHDHELLLNARSRCCDCHASGGCNSSKKKTPLADRLHFPRTSRKSKNGPRENYPRYDDEDLHNPRMRKSASSSRHQENFRHDPGSEDQESASELTSQLRGGMSLSDDQDPPVSEEFLAFMQQTIRHKEEWAKKKAAALQKQAVVAGSSLVTQVGDEMTLQQEHPDVVRSREMKALYGPAAPQLHAMETAVQLAFDRITTRHHAQVWPNIPINVIFSDE